MEHSVSPIGSEKESFDFEALLDEGIRIDFPRKGEIREGVIASITPDQILVNVGTKSEGVITGRELESIPKDILESFDVDQPILVYILDPEDQNGNLVLSYTKAYEEQIWKKAEEAMASKEAIDSVISGYNKGGLIVDFGILRGFIPASQIALSRRMDVSGESPEQRYGKMVGQPIRIRIIEVDRERRRLIFSERQASSETRESLKQKVIDGLTEGEILTGRVASLADFGAFININGMADGLVHLSEISWDHIRKPSDVLQVGQEVQVKVISVDKEKNRIGLSIRQTQDDPWLGQVAKYQVGQLVEGVITRLTKFGAFAKLDDAFEGLIHISEISDKRIEHAKEVLKEGDKVTLRIIKIDPANHRIGLSVRRVDSMAYSEMDWDTLMADLDSLTEE
ncbi:30S ribosomal protein S1 [Anaerolineaceae bacterium oral taxon 439]|nr:30S ribosomal protein S1 [Anaerolineaceae bacterium oral taxon 439]